MAIGNKHKKVGKDRMCSSEVMIMDRQTHTRTDTLITILCFPIGGGLTIICVTLPTSVFFVQTQQVITPAAES